MSKRVGTYQGPSIVQLYDVRPRVARFSVSVADVHCGRQWESPAGTCSCLISPCLVSSTVPSRTFEERSLNPQYGGITTVFETAQRKGTIGFWARASGKQENNWGTLSFIKHPLVVMGIPIPKIDVQAGAVFGLAAVVVSGGIQHVRHLTADAARSQAEVRALKIQLVQHRQHAQGLEAGIQKLQNSEAAALQRAAVADSSNAQLTLEAQQHQRIAQELRDSRDAAAVSHQQALQTLRDAKDLAEVRLLPEVRLKPTFRNAKTWRTQCVHVLAFLKVGFSRINSLTSGSLQDRAEEQRDNLMQQLAASQAECSKTLEQAQLLHDSVVQGLQRQLHDALEGRSAAEGVAGELQGQLAAQQEAFRAVSVDLAGAQKDREEVVQHNCELQRANATIGDQVRQVQKEQKQIQADAAAKMSKRAGQDFLFDRGISDTANAGSGIPADYGAAPGNPTPKSPLGPTPTVSNGMASTDIQEDGRVPLTQSQGNTPVPTTIATHHLTDAGANSITHAPNMEVATAERPEEIIEEVIPVSNDCLEENRLAVVIKQLLKMVEAAANPAQGTHFHLISGGVNVNECLLPGDKGSQVATLNIDAFLVSVDVFQQEDKLTAAFTLMTKVLGVAHWASLPAGKQAELHGRRALVSRAANQPVASFADWLHAIQLDPSSSAAVEVVNQLGQWGNSDSICLFFQGIQGCLRDGGGTCCDALQARVDFWLSAGRCIAKVVNKAPSPKESGEALIEEMSPLVRRFPQNQAVMCLQARQLLQLGRFQDVLQAVAPSLGCNSDLAPSRWALHLTLHVHWLTGGLDQMVVALQKLLKTECSPLEGSVGYTVPLNNLLAPLLTQLEGLQALWAQVDRCFLGDVDSAEGVLKQVDASCRGLMSPLLRSRQLLLWAQLHYARACCAMNAGQPAVQNVLKALAACERAKGSWDPCVLRKAVEMQAYLLRMLGSGGALYDLYSAVLTEPDLTAEELVDYSALQAAADPLPLPGLCDTWDAMHKPPLNPAQLLGVTFDATPEQVSSARNKLTVACHPDKACLPGNSFVAELEGVGALVGDVALQDLQ
ncbi:MAG: hypothetical protein FRX49_13235 [Trebouxia sp. A1-2]|nr:MAG: hypothetical protein FRX49_13235 [Trebouxia sp. A1-2]